MSAAYALKTARALGIRLRLDGDDLELEASLPPPSTVLDLLSRHKTDILRLLRPANDGWSPEDWQFFFDERASIAEFDGGMPRAEAERRAFASPRDRMAQPQPHAVCIRTVPRLRRWGAKLSSPLLPFGSETRGHAWLHRACWPAWCRAREADAIAALAGMDIAPGRLAPPSILPAEIVGRAVGVGTVVNVVS